MDQDNGGHCQKVSRFFDDTGGAKAFCRIYERRVELGDQISDALCRLDFHRAGLISAQVAVLTVGLGVLCIFSEVLKQIVRFFFFLLEHFTDSVYTAACVVDANSPTT